MGIRSSQIPELIRDWSEIASDALVAHGMPKEAADRAAFDVVRRICNEYAGQQVCLPIWLAQQISDRDAAIVREAAQGVDISVLVKRYKLHFTTIYAILRRAQQAEVAARQRPLFDD